MYVCMYDGRLQRGRDEVWDQETIFSQLAAVTVRGGQRIITIFSHLVANIVRREKRTDRGNNSIIEKIIPCLFVFFANRIFPMILKLQDASDSLN